MLVHLWGGTIEAHFHFFVVVALLTLYQSWLPFLLGLVYVVGHHGIVGTLAPEAVYNHAAAVASPWQWALIHAAFVLAASAANVAAWRLNEHLLEEIADRRANERTHRCSRRPGKASTRSTATGGPPRSTPPPRGSSAIRRPSCWAASRTRSSTTPLRRALPISPRTVRSAPA